MGTNVSKSTYENEKQVIQSSVNKVLNKFRVETSQSSGSVNKVIVRPKNVKMKCGSLTASISNKVNLGALSNLDFQSASQLTGKLSAKVGTDLVKRMVQQNEDLNLGQTNVATDSTKVKTLINNSMKNVVKNEISNSMTQSTTMKNTVIFEPEFSDFDIAGECSFSVKQVVDMVADNVTTGIMQNIMDNKAVTEIMDRYKLEMDQSNKGVDPFGFIKYIAIAVVSFLVIVFLVIVGFFFLPGKSKMAARVPMVLGKSSSPFAFAAGAIGQAAQAAGGPSSAARVARTLGQAAQAVGGSSSAAHAARTLGQAAVQAVGAAGLAAQAINHADQ